MTALLTVPSLAHAASESFRTPTKEELSMTELPGYPGAEAVVLNREEEDRDDLHVVKRYERIKILTEKGKDLANVELRFVTHMGEDYFDVGDEKEITDIEGRTIHPDGTVIPFKGKPYLKVLEKTTGAKYQARVFTLPEVEVGSIIEYRYAVRIADHYFEPPDWLIQGDYFVKQAHYVWYPTTHILQTSNGALINMISWFPILPPGVEIEKRDLPGTTTEGTTARVYEVHVKDVPPFPKEDDMPPIAAFSYRVLFNFSEYHSAADYWKGTGKEWSKNVDSFIDKDGSEMRDITAQVTAGATTQEEKLRKIYAAVEALENTSFTRERGEQEDKAAGQHKVNSAAEVYKHGRGNRFQITDLFVGMARAAGMKAYVMRVPDRADTIFTPEWLNLAGQLQDMIAVVNVDGKDQYFDPGSRYTPYGHLEWQHTYIDGLRQVDGGTGLGKTPGELYTDNKTTRVANLVMDEKGQVHGKVDLGFYGAPAVGWRQKALEGDEESLRHSLQKELEKMLPQTVDVKVDTVQNLTDYEKPLLVSFQVNGAVGTPTGKRLMVPADLFVADEPAKFTHEKRETAVYFPYPETVLDALRIKLPPNLAVEAVPDSSKTPFTTLAVHSFSVKSDANSFTTRRQFSVGTLGVFVKEYPALRTFYSSVQTKDHESVVLKQVAPVAAPAAGGGQ